jgi:hypothetical protein
MSAAGFRGAFGRRHSLREWRPRELKPEPDPRGPLNLSDTGRSCYPGWYHGRAVHVHFKIRSAPTATPGFEFTSQLYFDDALTDQVHSRPPYAAKGRRNRRNSGDGIFARGGSQLLLAPVRSGQGYTATFEVAVQNPTA